MQITNSTVLNLVIGNPLTHTKSPHIHQIIYQHLGLDAVLLAKAYDDIESLIAAIRTLDVKLTAVTVPYKEKVIHYLDDYSQEVQAIGACNTIIQQNGILRGYNTDIDGIAYAFRETPIYRKKALIIGAGGSARSAAYFLTQHEANIFWYNRTLSKAKKLADIFGGNVITQQDLNNMEIEVIINTTPIGLYPNQQETPLPKYRFNENQVVFDMVYNPHITKLLHDAQKHQAIFISGIEMFIGQAIKQVELWQDKSFDANQVCHLLRKEL